MYTELEIRNAYSLYKSTMIEYMESIKAYNLAKAHKDSAYQLALYGGDIGGKNDDYRMGNFIELYGHIFENYQNAKLATMDTEIKMKQAEIDVRCIELIMRLNNHGEQNE